MNDLSLINSVCGMDSQTSGSMLLSMDALFGLPRKKAAGISHRDAIHGHLFFGNQRSVDEFVSDSAPIKTSKVL